MHRVHYDSSHMGLARSMGCTALLALVCTAGIKAQNGGRELTQPEAANQSIVGLYSKTFKPGMSRKEVEINLRAPRTSDFSKGAADGLVKIGQEPAPWYCNRTNVYVAFAFVGEGRRPSSPARDSDKLERVRLFRWPEDCL
jgi:hypothetical protein